MTYVKWKGSLWHSLKTDYSGDVITQCGKRVPHTVNRKESKPDPGRHCVNCRRSENANRKG